MRRKYFSKSSTMPQRFSPWRSSWQSTIRLDSPARSTSSDTVRAASATDRFR